MGQSLWMTRVSPKCSHRHPEEGEDTTHTGGGACEHGAERSDDAGPSRLESRGHKPPEAGPEVPGSWTRSPRKPEEARNGFSPRASRGSAALLTP